MVSYLSSSHPFYILSFLPPLYLSTWLTSILNLAYLPGHLYIFLSFFSPLPSSYFPLPLFHYLTWPICLATCIFPSLFFSFPFMVFSSSVYFLSLSHILTLFYHYSTCPFYLLTFPSLNYRQNIHFYPGKLPFLSSSFDSSPTHFSLTCPPSSRPPFFSR